MANNLLVYSVVRYNPKTHEMVKVGTSTAAALAQTLSKFDRRRTQKQESDSCIHIHGDAMISRVVKRPKRRRH